MTRLLPQGTDPLNTPSHSKLHRVVSVDSDSPEQAIDVGATGDVTIAGNVLPNTIQLDTTPTVTPKVGQIYWDTADGTVSINLDVTNGVTLQLGEEQFIRVVNKTGSIITDGSVVRVSGAQGNRPTAVLAQANTFQSSVVIGVATQDIGINDEGFVTTNGIVNGFDTSVFSAAGAYLYLDSATPGVLTENVTTPVPAFVVPVAVAMNKTNNGSIFVSPFYPRSTDGTFAGNSNSYSPSEKAVKTYADTKVPITVQTDGNWPNGFCITNDGVVTADTTMSFDTTTKIFTLAKVNATFSFYCGGTKYTKSANQTVDLSSGWTNNTLYYIYENSAGVLSFMTTEWDITGNAAPVATLLWNGTATFAVIADERHSSKNNNAWHEWAHDNIGARIPSSDFSITTLNSSSTIINGGTISDEDIHTTVSSPQTDRVRIVYRDGAALTYGDTLSATSASIVGGALKYDASGTLTSVTNNWFIRNILLVTNVQNAAGPIVCRVAQEQFSNINDARNSNPPTATTYLSNESREIYSVIWQNVEGTPTLIEYADFRSAPTLPNGFPAKTPIFLDSVQDVAASNPSSDDVLKWNGLNWVNGAGSAVSGSAGIDFYHSSPQILALSTENEFPIKTFSKTPTVSTTTTVTMTSANPGVFTVSNHGFVAGTNVVFSTDGALPTAIVAGTTYFVSATGLTSSAFQVSATLGGGSVNTSAGVQSGTHSITVTERIVSGAVSASNVPTAIAAFLYNTALGRTTIDAGVWNFTNWVGMSSVTGNNLFTENIYSVDDDANTLTTTNLTGTSKTATASGGTPFAGLAASYATALVAPYLRTPKGLYKILTVSSSTVCTIQVPAGYGNEAGVAFGLWKPIALGTNSADISTVTPSYTALTPNVVTSAVSISATTKLGAIVFVTSDNTGRTLSATYNGTARSSHVTSPLITLHNNLSGVQGLVGNEAYHITAAQATVVSNTSGTNTGDNSANTNAGLVHVTGAESITGIKTFDKDVLKLKGTAAGVTILSNANTSGTDYTAVFPARNITVDNITTGTTTDGTGFLKGNGTVISFDNTTYAPTTTPTFVTSITTPSVLATANDSGAIGASGTAFSDLFLASGGVINWNAGNATLTHSAGLITSNVAFSIGTSNAFTCGSLELGAASDTTFTRISGGVVAIEGNNILTANTGLALAGGTMTGKMVTAGRSEVGKTYTPATGSQTVALDCVVNNFHIVTGHASGTAITFTVANVTDSQCFIVSILQGAVVSTIAGWFATIRWAGGSAPTLTATVGKRDTFGFIRTGADTYDGFVIGQNC